MKPLTYYIACSLDGFIAHEDGSHDGFSQDADYIAVLAQTFPETFPAHFREPLNIQGENQCFDVVLMGRKTYEVGSNAGITNPYPHLKQYLFSKKLKSSPDREISLISEDVIATVKTIKNESSQGVWLCGGGTLASTLFSEGLIDQLILKVNPFLMGAGIPLFAEAIPQTALKLVGSQTYRNGVARLHYQLT